MIDTVSVSVLSIVERSYGIEIVTHFNDERLVALDIFQRIVNSVVIDDSAILMQDNILESNTLRHLLAAEDESTPISPSDRIGS
ncbi:hypothetical protein [Haladaptatus cibarius]|uniref:hypothetical protein n=1 Tax=Haladaptatus cibarius TaxID=453847 RepID=UPI0011866C35|nr:hypothetical protein [Haladaptatus cibarius]